MSKLLALPEVRQRNPNDCGPAVARSVLRYFERPVCRVDSTLRPHPEDGTLVRRMADLFIHNRLAVTMRERLSVEQLGVMCQELGPVLCLVTWDRYGHWVLVRGVKRGRVYLMDPESGYCDVPAAEFVAAWHDTDGDVKLDRFGMAVWDY